MQANYQKKFIIHIQRFVYNNQNFLLPNIFVHCCTWNILSFFKLWKTCTSKKQYSVAYGCYLICVAVKYVHSTFSLTLKERLYLLPNRFKRILTHNIEKPLPAKLKVLGKKPTHTKNKPTEKELSHSRRLYAFSADSKCSSWVNISAFASLGKQTEPGRGTENPPASW